MISIIVGVFYGPVKKNIIIAKTQLRHFSFNSLFEHGSLFFIWK